MSTPPTFLQKDPTIRGQNWACVSFVSPEDFVLRRELFDVMSFLKPLADDVRSFVENIDSDTVKRVMREKYAYLWDSVEMQAFFSQFRSDNVDRLDREYVEQHGPRTSIRAVKIRGIYDTVEEARAKCCELREFDQGLFNIYVAAVGCWLPWSPNPSEIADNVYAETQLNQLMSKYADNAKLKDKFYRERADAIIGDRKNTDDDNEEETDENGVSVRVIQSSDQAE